MCCTKKARKSFPIRSFFCNFASETKKLSKHLSLTQEMEIQGRIIAVLPERSGVSARGEWKSQEFVIETVDSQYPRKMVFTVFGADRLQRFAIQGGQDVTVSFDIDAHEWNGRWFNDIRAYDVRPAVVGQGAPAGQPAYNAPQAAPVVPQAALAENAPAASMGDSADDLPF